jgi:hypothetical protein
MNKDILESGDVKYAGFGMLCLDLHQGKSMRRNEMQHISFSEGHGGPVGRKLQPGGNVGATGFDLGKYHPFRLGEWYPWLLRGTSQSYNRRVPVSE